ncbi:methyl-accepting chemotaxis protein [Ferrigenium kumadai]|nr:methyl-accepting chemotaxis protein [Ferrigenium kumadai]
MSTAGGPLGNMSIGSRLAAGFIVVVVLFVANLLMVGVSFSHLMQDIQLIKEETLPYVLSVDEMDTARSEVQQWLTDVSATHDRDGYKDADAAAKRFLAGVEKYKQMYQLEHDTDNLKKIQDIEASFNTFYTNGKAMAEAYITQGLDAGNTAMEGFDKDSETISGELAKFREQQIAEANGIVANTVSSAELTMKEMAGGGLIAALLATIFSALISRSIIRPVSAMKSTMVEIGKTGDFTRRIAVDSKDEIGQTARSFNELIGNLQATLHELHDGIDRLFDSSRALSTSSHQVATSSAHQSEAASAMAATVEEVTVSINHVSESAREALQLSRKSGELSGQGGEIIHNAAAEMRQIADTVRQTSISIEELGQQSTQISSIVQVIKEIAEQTNLLALNAAIEAARAGEQGRGFAVVADEVRKLAERTSSATEEITQMIDSIQNTARVAVGSMSGAVNQVDSGVALAQQAGDAINQIKDGSEQVLRTVGDISSALVEQSAASNDIASHVEKVAQMTEENSAAAEETSGSATTLAQLADGMRTAINRFRC